MTAQAADLVAQRRRCYHVLLRPPLVPFLPGAATHPAAHDEDAEAVGLVPEAIVFVIAFQPQGIEMHVERVSQLRVLPLRLWAQEHVGRPTAATNENATAVDAEKSPALWRRFRRDLTDAETQILQIGHASIFQERQGERVQLGLPELRWPPEARGRETKLWKTVGSEAH